MHLAFLTSMFAGAGWQRTTGLRPSRSSVSLAHAARGAADRAHEAGAWASAAAPHGAAVMASGMASGARACAVHDGGWRLRSIEGAENHEKRKDSLPRVTGAHPKNRKSSSRSALRTCSGEKAYR